eukprot:TRINITY_DN43282_c0_g1_i1.p1 TRINITY_DN43282_c0_g1~~TRINITY_DN43282_c0_g1_i1.p1  ORF type:complete len:212 (-),score=26.77 TRINITY_DN43282_c0_g1_i1:216-851(-)
MSVSMGITNYDEAQVDGLLRSIEGAVEKVHQSQDKMVKLRSAETNLLRLFEEIRNVMHDMLANQSDRSELESIFGGDCQRLARVFVALDNTEFSDMYASDPRKEDCMRVSKSVEAVLNEGGYKKAIQEAKMRVGRSRATIRQLNRAVSFDEGAEDDAVEEPQAASAAEALTPRTGRPELQDKLRRAVAKISLMARLKMMARNICSPKSKKR